MEKVRNAISEIHEINSAYSLADDTLTALAAETDSVKVCVPIVGKFSAGKSALLNAVLGYRNGILKENITPETAVPAEIIYTDADECVSVVSPNGSTREITFDEYEKLEANVNTVKCTRIYLNNSFLHTIPDVTLVDMPGFESGYEIHDRVIDEYLPNSHAYIVAFPADDLVVRRSVGTILKELNMNNMPICIVITKSDKINSTEDFNAMVEHMKGSLRKYVGDRELRICVTSSRTKEGTDELKQYLTEIQENSQSILSAHYAKRVIAEADKTAQYLRSILNADNLSESELAEREETIKREMAQADTNYQSARIDFNRDTAGCIEAIKGDVQMALENDISTFVSMAMNGQPIVEHLNEIVREAVTMSLKKNYTPLVNKYVRRTEDAVSGDEIGRINVSINLDSNLNESKMTSPLVAGAASGLTFAAAGLLMTGVLLPGLGAAIGLVVGIYNKFKNDKKREEAKNNIRQKLQDGVFPETLASVGRNLEAVIAKQNREVNALIDREMNGRKSLLQKTIDDVRAQIAAADEEKARRGESIQQDLQRLEEIKDELR